MPFALRPRRRFLGWQDLGSEVQELHYRGEYGKAKCEGIEEERFLALRDATAEMGTAVILEVTSVHRVLKLLAI